MQPGTRGFLVTCFRGREGAATKEAYHVLEPLLSSDGDSSEDERDAGAFVDMEQAVMAEVSALKDRRRRPIVAVKIPQVSCVLFMQLASARDKESRDNPLPSELIDRHYERMPKTRHCQRIVPVDVVCQAHAKDIIAAVGKLVQGAEDALDALSYAVIIERRMSSVLAEQAEKDQLIRQLAVDVLRPRGLVKVDLKQPDLAVMLQVVKGVCGVSLLRDYHRRRKYNFSHPNLVMDKNSTHEGDNNAEDGRKNVAVDEKRITADDVRLEADIADRNQEKDGTRACE